MPVCKVTEAYQPEISPGGVLTPMPANDITVVNQKNVTFAYPFDTQTTILTLRAPELSNTVETTTQRVQGYTRGDTLYQYKDPNWFQTRIFNWAFTGLTRQNRIDILAFVLISAGKYVTIVDYDGQTYKCIIMNPNSPITQEGPDYAQLPVSPPVTTLPGSLYTWKVDLQKALI